MAPASRPPLERLISVRQAAHGRGGYTLFISGRSRTRWVWIAPHELPEVIAQLWEALDPEDARALAQRLADTARQS
jgi:hypothetical protein